VQCKQECPLWANSGHRLCFVSPAMWNGIWNLRACQYVFDWRPFILNSHSLNRSRSWIFSTSSASLSLYFSLQASSVCAEQ